MGRFKELGISLTDVPEKMANIAIWLVKLENHHTNTDTSGSVQGGYFGLRGLSGRKWFIFLSSRMSMTSFFPLENWQEVKSGADEKSCYVKKNKSNCLSCKSSRFLLLQLPSNVLL